MSLNAVPAATFPDDGTASQARAYLLDHDERVKVLDKQPLHVLRTVWAEGLALKGQTSLFGGPDDHDSLVNYIADQEFPDAQKARDVYHAWVLAAQPAIGQE